MPLSKYRYIVVEGPIGVGKTSLAQRLADFAEAHPLLEKPQENPFLANFYQDPARYALPTQLFFLFQRINEARDLAQMDLFRSRTISDYLFEKDALFARLTLSDDEYKLYQSIYQGLAPQAPAPDLVIYLQAPTFMLSERVRRRGNRYERPIQDDYLEKLSASYGEFFHHYDDAPLLVVNSEHLNFVDNADDFDLLLDRIAKMKGRREYFNVGRD
ncbi:MAG: deoxynucleoside kinase [Gammaproteobacteria bacterium]|nr:deoxynucleoside kinase [Gammaproteobacteria bacterium]MBU1777041.1 deoxynucleoside kinase [Gammaproteobacteria bacterium]MBU1969062.1 deoxynucleoside kinase [Gammaproteobacteria bacterium]